ncbi:MerR family transcriptional regulator [Pararhizobium haloflavum]|uniref:MerR family transcriptional regulator n=1 Tax=Pararhizobium haloflavum TaxID=2037914 RepID=UPI000C17DB81|nr:helix-turn-helix domain-containing protein [Pararhizobium haloflavum]
MFSIGELAKRTAVKVPTIRYYEQIGLIDPPHRSEGNQRRYEPDTLDRLSFIRHGRDLGLSLEAIRDLIELSHHPERPCGRADAIVAEQLAAVRARIARLKRLERELDRMSGCGGGHTVGDCYVLRSIADHDLCASDHD